MAFAHGVAEVEVSTQLLESDAQAHKHAKRKAYDAKVDEWLSKGFKPLRWN
jgi:hypothetical protein